MLSFSLSQVFVAVIALCIIIPLGLSLLQWFMD